MYTVHEVKMENAPVHKRLYYLTSKNQISIKRPPQLRDHFSSFP